VPKLSTEKFCNNDNLLNFFSHIINIQGISFNPIGFDAIILFGLKSVLYICSEIQE
jgi:hypothetical protein